MLQEHLAAYVAYYPAQLWFIYFPCLYLPFYLCGFKAGNAIDKPTGDVVVTVVHYVRGTPVNRVEWGTIGLEVHYTQNGELDSPASHFVALRPPLEPV